MTDLASDPSPRHRASQYGRHIQAVQAVIAREFSTQLDCGCHTAVNTANPNNDISFGEARLKLNRAVKRAGRDQLTCRKPCVRGAPRPKTGSKRARKYFRPTSSSCLKLPPFLSVSPCILYLCRF